MKYEPKTQMKAALKVSKQTRGYLIGEEKKKKENNSGKWRWPDWKVDENSDVDVGLSNQTNVDVLPFSGRSGGSRVFWGTYWPMKDPSSVNRPGSVSPYSAMLSVSDSALDPVKDLFSSSSLKFQHYFENSWKSHCLYSPNFCLPRMGSRPCSRSLWETG